MRLIWCILLTFASATSLAACEEYSHDYDTFKISFSTPPGVTAQVDWGTGISWLATNVKLSTGEEVFYWSPTKLESPESASKENLAKLWDDITATERSPTTITKLDNGDYLVSGRMVRLGSMFTSVLRTFDINGDGNIDATMKWNGQGKVKYDTLNYLASTTKINLEPNWN